MVYVVKSGVSEEPETVKLFEEFDGEVQVLPGDLEIERGLPFTVKARFNKEVPGDVYLWIKGRGEGESEARRITMERSFDDEKRFLVKLPAVYEDSLYRVEYVGKASDEYEVKVYAYPRVENADVVIHYPDYLKRDDEVVKRTRVAKAVEGSTFRVEVEVNQAMKAVKLVKKNGESIELKEKSSEEALSEGHRLYAAELSPARTQRYGLKMESVEGRENRKVEQFVFKIIGVKKPKVKLLFPADNTRVTPVEELTLEASFESSSKILDHGLTYSLAGKEIRTVKADAEEVDDGKFRIKQVLALEEEGVKQNDLITWYGWVRDVGPDGKERVVNSHMLTARVRAFDERFWQVNGVEVQGEGICQGLICVQKQIVDATWNLVRENKEGRKMGLLVQDAEVVKKTQEVNIQKLDEAVKMIGDARAIAILTEARKFMEMAVQTLSNGVVEQRGESLDNAHGEGTDALGELMKLAGKDIQLVKAKPKSGRGESREGRKLDIDLEDRMRTYQKANLPGAIKESEIARLKLLKQLKELAQYQKDLSERLKQLQYALTQAKNEEERALLEKELERLREDQEELLARMDQERERMSERGEESDSKGEMAGKMAEAREAMRQAAEAMKEKKLGSAIASSAKGVDRLERAQESLKEQSKSGVAQKMGELVAKVEEVRKEQKKLSKELWYEKGIGKGRERERNGGGLKKVGDEGFKERAQEQEKMFKEMMKEMEAFANRVEEVEPLVAKELEDVARLAQQLEVQKHLEGQREALETLKIAEALNHGTIGEAGLEHLEKALNEAARQVMGGKDEAMAYARNELSELAEQLKDELKQCEVGTKPGNGKSGKTTKKSEEARGQGSGGMQPDPKSQGGQKRKLAQAQGVRDRSAEEVDQAGKDEQRGAEPEQMVDRENSVGGKFCVNGPVMGGGYQQWNERLKDVEVLLQDTKVRERLTDARETLRQMRIDFKRHSKEPEWLLVQEKVLKPLLEAEEELSRELRQRSGYGEVADMDRESVPERYSRLVKRYYEELAE